MKTATKARLTAALLLALCLTPASPAQEKPFLPEEVRKVRAALAETGAQREMGCLGSLTREACTRWNDAADEMHRLATILELPPEQQARYDFCSGGARERLRAVVEEAERELLPVVPGEGLRQRISVSLKILKGAR